MKVCLKYLLYFTWYMAYLGTIFRVRRAVFKCMNVMATGHRAMIVKMPTNGFIHIVAPVIPNCNVNAHGRVSKSEKVKERSLKNVQIQTDIFQSIYTIYSASPCHQLTSARSKVPLVQRTIERMVKTIFRRANWKEPSLSRKRERLEVEQRKLLYTDLISKHMLKNSFF